MRLYILPIKHPETYLTSCIIGGERHPLLCRLHMQLPYICESSVDTSSLEILTIVTKGYLYYFSDILKIPPARNLDGVRTKYPSIQLCTFLFCEKFTSAKTPLIGQSNEQSEGAASSKSFQRKSKICCLRQNHIEKVMLRTEATLNGKCPFYISLPSPLFYAKYFYSEPLADNPGIMGVFT